MRKLNKWKRSTFLHFIEQLISVVHVEIGSSLEEGGVVGTSTWRRPKQLWLRGFLVGTTTQCGTLPPSSPAMPLRTGHMPYCALRPGRWCWSRVEVVCNDRQHKSGESTQNLWGEGGSVAFICSGRWMCSWNLRGRGLLLPATYWCGIGEGSIFLRQQFSLNKLRCFNGAPQ